jgi:hypothetical protein
MHDTWGSAQVVLHRRQGDANCVCVCARVHARVCARTRGGVRAARGKGGQPGMAAAAGRGFIDAGWAKHVHALHALVRR